LKREYAETIGCHSEKLGKKSSNTKKLEACHRLCFEILIGCSFWAEKTDTRGTFFEKSLKKTLGTFFPQKRYSPVADFFSCGHYWRTRLCFVCLFISGFLAPGDLDVVWGPGPTLS
jgi:hypothetical protein